MFGFSNFVAKGFMFVDEFLSREGGRRQYLG